MFEANPYKKKKRCGIKRETADRLIKELLQRVETMNASNDKYTFPFKVTRVIVFGSYLTDKPMLGDIDIFYDLEYNWDDASEMTRYFSDLYYKETSAYNHWVDSAYYAFIKTKKYLRDKSKALSLHGIDEYENLKSIPNFTFKEIYNLNNKA